MQDLGDALADVLPGRAPVELRKRIVDVKVAQFAIVKPDADRRRLEESPQQLQRLRFADNLCGHVHLLNSQTVEL